MLRYYTRDRFAERHQLLRWTRAAYISNLLDRHYPRDGRSKPSAEAPRVRSSAVTNAHLSRLFAACVREISHLLSILRKGDYLSEAPLTTVLEVSFKVKLQNLNCYLLTVLTCH